MQSPDFFHCRIDSMIDMRKPLAVLAQRLPWDQIKEALAPKLKRKERAVCSQSIQRDFGVCDAIGLRWR
jgi:IS5 family transposase